ncbi:MAG: hypothetical protein AB7G12_10750 [Thermoanaerobaculia bacterium]
MATRKTSKDSTNTTKTRAPRPKKSASDGPNATVKTAATPRRKKEGAESATAKRGAAAKSGQSAPSTKRGKSTKPAATAEPKVVAAVAAEVAAQPASPTHAEIAARAAEIWRESGGTPFSNWLQAERELRA